MKGNRLQDMETSVLDSLTTWARRACGKASVQAEDTPAVIDDQAAFRLRAWPELPDLLRTAPIYRLMSVMTVRAVSRRWMMEQSRLQARDIDALLAHLEAGGELVQETAASWTPRARAHAPALFAG